MNLICSGKKKKIAGFLVLFLLFSCVFFLFACGERNKILVGFSGPLTGKYSDLGVQGRNGVTLAIEEINAQGGLNGRKLELIPKDD
ncbi:MAG: ABC transporter substrate-binding protein, partial [Thermodesulfobacteriota bacterium]